MSKPPMDRRAFVRRAVVAAGVAPVLGARAADGRPPELIMGTLSDLHRAIAAVLRTKQVGVPVFGRYTLYLADEKQELPRPLLHLAEVVRGWMDQTLARVFTTEAGETQLCLTMEFAGGATAIVSIVRQPAGPGSADLILLGNHGAVYHEAAFVTADLPKDFKPDKSLQRAVDRSLRSKKPERLEAP